MGLSKKLAGEFSRKIRMRGQFTFRDGLVFLHTGNESNVEAVVKGHEEYRVDIARSADEVRASCTCPYFRETGPCKHLWATLIASDKKGFLKGDGKPGRVSLVLQDAPRPQDATNGHREVAAPPPRPPIAMPPTKRPPWKDHVDAAVSMRRQLSEPWPAGRELVYAIDVPMSVTTGRMVIEVLYRERKQTGEWGKIKNRRTLPYSIQQLPDPADREIFSLLTGSHHYVPGYLIPGTEIETQYQLLDPAPEIVVPLICRTGRCWLRTTAKSDELSPLKWDERGSWEFRLSLDRESAGWSLRGMFHRGDDRMDLSTPILVIEGGIFIAHGRAASFRVNGASSWIPLLRRLGRISARDSEQDDLLAELLRQSDLPNLDVPEELRYEVIAAPPRPRLRIGPGEANPWGMERLHGRLSFDYSGELVEWGEQRSGVFDSTSRRFVRRDIPHEQAAAELLNELGFRLQPPTYERDEWIWELPPAKLSRVVRELIREDWWVEAEGKSVRRASGFKIELASNIDWFELRGGVDFDGAHASLPELLKALQRGETTIRLDDGTIGMLPEEWLVKFGPLATLGAARGDNMIFGRNQVGVLDALLAAQPEITCDETFNHAREQLLSFEGLKAPEQPQGFEGTLRHYQRDGLGWMEFLAQFGFGGCLADDMGVGKTAQVLALLENRRQLRAAPENGTGPSLVVVPRSLVFNWKAEAARFTPGIRVLDHTGAGRSTERFEDADMVLTTYGTLRRDAMDFKDIQFDYVILDEAQAIKNADSESAKAARLLRGNHRLALSGTPVENHLGELWSLFEFLNPGMLGTASVFKNLSASLRNPDEPARKQLAQAVRPFILRRTKEQVAPELPPKVEQTLFCEMEPGQRRMYEDLRNHYRRTLLGKVEAEGLSKSKMHVLEALLRLRQVACHPGLVDTKRTNEPSAKLELLWMQLDEVIDEGHKALVFSQFTSFLSILRKRLDHAGVTYEYLDGRIRDRASRVNRFQTDPDCKLFLISLKAGGLGLNLTAAEYVFLMDPWWNPAVEAQAIDRAHRIGQNEQVFAYRLIAKGTVEEKVLDLQKTKRDLADAIINADNSLVSGLSREDLELLLS